MRRANITLTPLSLPLNLSNDFIEHLNVSSLKIAFLVSSAIIAQLL